MALETGTFISDLVDTNPTGSDPLAFADDHLRLVKSTIKSTFPNISGAVTKTHSQINTAVDQAGTAVQPSVMDAAIAAAVAATKLALYPVGSIYTNATNATNPGTLLGFGTWAAFGAGRVPVGFDASNALFDTAEETGGSADAIVVTHTHTTESGGIHQHFTVNSSAFNTSLTDSTTIAKSEISGSNNDYDLQGQSSAANIGATSSAGSHTHAVNSTGSSGTNANLQPYITVFMWKRTA